MIARSTRLFIFLGAFLLFLTFFKGDGGYHDLVYYLDDAQGLWLRGDMARPDEFEEIDQPDGSVVERPVYSQYALGLAFVSGPFVLLGRGLERLTNGAIHARTVAVLIIPLLGALSALLLFEIGRALNVSASASMWAATLFVLGTPALTFTRLFYTETAIVFFLLFAVWAFLKTQDRTLSPWRALLWSLLAGAGLAGAGACHYAEGVTVAMLWLGMAGTFLLINEIRPDRSRVLNVFALSTLPILAVSTILYVNYLRRGHFLDTGYSSDVAEISLKNIGYNWRYFFFAVETKVKLGLFLRSPWIVLGAAALLASQRDAKSIWLRRALVAAGLLQTLFWMSYAMLGFSPVRYLYPTTGMLSVALLCLGAQIEALWRMRGLYLSGLLLIACNLYFFFAGDDRNLSLMFAPDTHALSLYSWYMRPFPNGILDGYGTELGVRQWFVLFTLAGFGIFCLAHAWFRILRAKLNHTD